MEVELVTTLRSKFDGARRDMIALFESSRTTGEEVGFPAEQGERRGKYEGGPSTGRAERDDDGGPAKVVEPSALSEETSVEGIGVSVAIIVGDDDEIMRVLQLGSSSSSRNNNSGMLLGVALQETSLLLAVGDDCQKLTDQKLSPSPKTFPNQESVEEGGWEEASSTGAGRNYSGWGADGTVRHETTTNRNEGGGTTMRPGPRLKSESMSMPLGRMMRSHHRPYYPLMELPSLEHWFAIRPRS